MSIVVGEVGLDKGLETFSAEIKQFLALVLLLLLSEPVFGLGHFEFAFALKGDKTDSQVCTPCKIIA